MSGDPPGPTDPGSPADLGFEERDLQAAEYVLGALPRNQAHALEVLAMTDPAVAASIAAWENRLAPLTDLVPPKDPPPVLWHRLALATGIDSIAAAPPAARRGGPGTRPGLWRSPALWRTTTVGAMAIAASLAFLLYAKPPSEPLVAALSPLNTPGATYLVRVGANGDATIVAVGTPDVPAGKSLELWAVAATPNATPVSLGLLPGSGRARLTIKLPPGTKLLVSQEPEGGSPTKAPTGPVIYGGDLTGT